MECIWQLRARNEMPVMDSWFESVLLAGIRGAAIDGTEAVCGRHTIPKSGRQVCGETHLALQGDDIRKSRLVCLARLVESALLFGERFDEIANRPTSRR